MSGDGQGRHSKAVGVKQHYRARHAARRTSYRPHATISVTAATALAFVAMTSSQGTAAAQVLPASEARPVIASTLSTAAHRADAVWYHTVADGESLSALAARYYGNPALWPALWWVNKAKIANPNALPAGLVIKIDPWHPAYGWLTAAADRAIPPPPPLPRPAVVVTVSRGRPPRPTGASATRPRPPAIPAARPAARSASAWWPASPAATPR